MMISETKAFKLLRQGKELKPNKEEDQNQTKTSRCSCVYVLISNHLGTNRPPYKMCINVVGEMLPHNHLVLDLRPRVLVGCLRYLNALALTPSQSMVYHIFHEPPPLYDFVLPRQMLYRRLTLPWMFVQSSPGQGKLSHTNNNTRATQGSFASFFGWHRNT